MNTTATKTAAEPEHICPTHLVRLSHLLKGGVGYCGKCGLYVRSFNHPPIQPTPEQQARREATRAGEQKRKARKAGQ